MDTLITTPNLIIDLDRIALMRFRMAVPQPAVDIYLKDGPCLTVTNEEDLNHLLSLQQTIDGHQ